MAAPTQPRTADPLHTWFAGAGDGMAHAVVTATGWDRDTGYYRTKCGKPSAQTGKTTTMWCPACAAATASVAPPA